MIPLRAHNKLKLMKQQEVNISWQVKITVFNGCNGPLYNVFILYRPT